MGFSSSRRTRRPYGTGLIVGFALTCALAAILFLGFSAGLPFIPFDVFDWVTRMLPGRLVIFGVETMSSLLQTLGFSIKDTAKTTEHMMAVAGFLATGAAVGLVFFAVVRAADRSRTWLLGVGTGLLFGLPVLGIVLTINTSSTSPAVLIVPWVLATFAAWGAALGWSATKAGRETRDQAGPEPGRVEQNQDVIAAGVPGQVVPNGIRPWSPAPSLARVDRRRFLIQFGGATAAITLVGAGLGALLRTSEQQPGSTSSQPPIPFPNAGSLVRPIPGTRPEYTPVADHYRIDIDAVPPSVDGTSWRLKIFGLVSNPLSLSIDQITTGYQPVNQFVTLACVSNPVGGPLIGTTLWTGARFQDVLAQAGVRDTAHYARVRSVDGYHETVALDLVRSEPRIMLAYDWNGAPLPRVHGYPLRIYIPDHYGMKQPRWIKEIELVDQYVDGYWVTRGWDREATMKATSVIDVVAVDGIVERNGDRYVPVGGIAHAGARGISKVEIQVDGGDWQPATLRPPLSDTTWVIWRYEWPFQTGNHVFSVRCTDGDGAPQSTDPHDPFPSGATGINSSSAGL